MPAGLEPNRPPAPAEAALRLAFSVLAGGTERLDRFLADQMALSRTRAAQLVAEKRVSVNGQPARASRLLVRGEEVVVDLPDAAPPRVLTPHAIPLTVVYEDEHVLVIDKPAGLVVHPAPGHWDDTLVNALAARGTSLGGGIPGRPGIVHRLDRDTSGLLLVARSDLAHRRLSAAIAARKVRRRYAALAWGHFEESRSTIEASIARHHTDRKRMGVNQTGRPARTEVQVLARFLACDLVRLTLETGRTHQIRVHLQHVGHPVVGDPVYHGGGSRRISGAARQTADRLERATPRQALHAAELAFRHPITGKLVHCQSDWPADLQPALEAAAWPERVAGTQPLSYLGFFGNV
ncbi:MAG TPA: RluA family pseudouridine synthase [Gemmatimonadales bacterium]|jgi:23S rRNA pseudouridine1911/1915/1917 synthase